MDEDLEELCENLSAFWDETLEKKMRMKIIDKAILEERSEVKSGKEHTAQR